MKILIRRMQSHKGAVTFVDRELDAASLRIGRGTAQDLEISDPRVALEHAEILLKAERSYRVEARNPNGVWVNGAPCAGSELECEDSLDFGRFHLTVLEPESGTDLALLVEERASTQRQDGELADHVIRLQDTRLSRRGLAWTGALLVLLCVLLLPLAIRYGSTPATALASESLPLVTTDWVWNSGPLSSTHAYFDTDCAACHIMPFERVPNQACVACHDGIRHHFKDAALATAPEFAGAQCTECHGEHQGAQGSVQRQAALCTGCHAETASRFAGTQLAEVRSFSSMHPPFSPLLTRYDPVARKFHATPAAQAQGAPLREETGLSFPHDLHLAAKGVDAPEGTRVLACPDCHVPDLGQTSFEPVRMERHCADCHRLEFDPDDSARVVPHGKPAEVAAVLRDHFAARGLGGQVKALGTLPEMPERRRPGPQRARAEHDLVQRWSETQGEQAVREVFAGRLCRYCHIVEETGDPALPWAIAPVNLQEHSLRGARFTHKPHGVTPCADCHDAQRSRSSSDVLLPNIENCRGCHGDAGGHSQVASECVDCHSYHASDAPLWDPLATPRRLREQMKHKTPATPRGRS